MLRKEPLLKIAGFALRQEALETNATNIATPPPPISVVCLNIDNKHFHIQLLFC